MAFINVIWFAAVVTSNTFFVSVAFRNNEVLPSCSEIDAVCEFHFDISYMETMVLYDKDKRSGQPVIWRDGRMWKRDPFSCSNFSPLTRTEAMKVAIGDGTRKLLFAVNLEFPGTPVVVYENQTVLIHVHNNLFNDGIAIHWHGIVQKNTPWMDGASMVTQCPINPGETFEYRFQADPIGTHWYHSHQGTERTEGLAGPFIVLPRKENKRTDLPKVKKEFIMFIQDWFRDMTPIRFHMFENWGMFPYSADYNSSKCFWATRSPDNMDVSTFPFHAALINGKGHYYPKKGEEPETNALPLETYEVKKNKYYKFRIINSALMFAFRLSIDGHKLRIVATDGNDIESEETESVIIQSGERFDIIVKTDAEPGNYWIRLETLETMDKNGDPIKPGKTLGILRYDGSSGEMPRTERRPCTTDNPCKVVNCPFSQYHKSENIVCLPIAGLRSTKDLRKRHPVPIPNEKQRIKEVFLNFHFAANKDNIFTAAVNGRSFSFPSCPPQVAELGKVQQCFDDCHDHDCGEYCRCTHTVGFNHEVGHIAQIVMVNNDDLEESSYHPIHIHGHHFHVMKIGFAETDNVTGRILGDNKDILCEGKNCVEQSWANDQWEDGNVPDLNFKNPPMKDTIIVPRKGYTVIRFPLDNPGYWYVHCHIETHQLLGMTLMLKEGLHQDMVPPPKDFPFCGGFKWSNDKDDGQKLGLTMNENSAHAEDSSEGITDDTTVPTTSSSTLMLTIGLCVLSVSLAIALSLTVYFYRKTIGSQSMYEYTPLLKH